MSTRERETPLCRRCTKHWAMSPGVPILHTGGTDPGKVGSVPEATQPSPCDPESVFWSHLQSPLLSLPLFSLACAWGAPQGPRPLRLWTHAQTAGRHLSGSPVLPANSLQHLEENVISHRGVFSFSRRPQSSIKNSNSQQLMYLFTLPDGGRRAARRRQLGRVQGTICLIVNSTPSRKVVAP